MEEIANAVYKIFPFTRITWANDERTRSVVITARWFLRGEGMKYDCHICPPDTINVAKTYIIDDICINILQSMYKEGDNNRKNYF